VNYPQIPELSERARLRVRHFFAELDARLGESEFVALDRFTIADITAFIAVEFARAIKETVPESAVHLAKWHARIAARPSARV
jgi:glutathione S-transferase